MKPGEHSSRYEIRCAAEPAWSADAHGTLYRFDGLRFSRRRRRDTEFSLVPAWQTPRYGWTLLPARTGPAAEPARADRRTAADPQPHLAA